MRLVQLSRHNIAFPSPEGALREPNGLLALAVTSALLGY
jgi:leucyl/phenylalanyl-tRNA--protein transferase